MSGYKGDGFYITVDNFTPRVLQKSKPATQIYLFVLTCLNSN